MSFNIENLNWIDNLYKKISELFNKEFDKTILKKYN